MIMVLDINCRKNSYSAYSCCENGKFCRYSAKNSTFTQKGKEKNAHFKTTSLKKSQILPVFIEIVAYLHEKSCI